MFCWLVDSRLAGTTKWNFCIFFSYFDAKKYKAHPKCVSKQAPNVSTKTRRIKMHIETNLP